MLMLRLLLGGMMMKIIIRLTLISVMGKAGLRGFLRLVKQPTMMMMMMMMVVLDSFLGKVGNLWHAGTLLAVLE
mgnify:CR=1 FL=1